MNEPISGEVTSLVISLREYESLLEDRRWRQCVEDAGVDNWPGIHYAMEAFHSEEEM